MGRAEVVLSLFAAGVCAAVALAPVPIPIRGAAALALALYLPGGGIVAVALVGRPSAETRVLSVALSIATCAPLGFVLNALHRLDAAGWAIGLCGVACLGYLSALARSPAPRAIPAAGPTHTHGSRAWRAGLLTLSVAITAGAALAAARGALSQHEYRFTDFWMVPEDVSKPSFATVGVRNEEGAETSYTIDIVARGALVDRYRSFVLPVRSERTFTVPLPNVTFAEAAPVELSGEPTDLTAEAAAEKRRQRASDTALRVEARLYKDGDRRIAYRTVWVALPPAVPPNPAPKLPSEAATDATTPQAPTLREAADQPLPSEVGMPTVRIPPRPVGSRLIPDEPGPEGTDDGPSKPRTNASAE